MGGAIQLTHTEVNHQMSPKFVTNMALALIGGFLVVASQAFITDAVAWLAFAVGIAAVVIAAAGQLDGTRHVAQWVLDLTVAALGVATIVDSLVYTGSTVD